MLVYLSGLRTGEEAEHFQAWADCQRPWGRGRLLDCKRVFAELLLEVKSLARHMSQKMPRELLHAWTTGSLGK